jgi:hypothetical protein
VQTLSLRECAVSKLRFPATGQYPGGVKRRKAETDVLNLKELEFRTGHESAEVSEAGQKNGTNQPLRANH